LPRKPVNRATILLAAGLAWRAAEAVEDLLSLSDESYFLDESVPLADERARRMQVLVDGRPVYGPATGGVRWMELPLDISDVERIEVIRGPNAAAYGANSFLGAINIVTQHPSEAKGTQLALLTRHPPGGDVQRPHRRPS